MATDLQPEEIANPSISQETEATEVTQETQVEEAKVEQEVQAVEAEVVEEVVEDLEAEEVVEDLKAEEVEEVVEDPEEVVQAVAEFQEEEPQPQVSSSETEAEALAPADLPQIPNPNLDLLTTVNSYIKKIEEGYEPDFEKYRQMMRDTLDCQHEVEALIRNIKKGKLKQFKVADKPKEEEDDLPVVAYEKLSQAMQSN